MTDDSPTVIDGPALARLLPVRDAVQALRTALLDGLAVSSTPPRANIPLSAGHLLLMPAEHGGYAGVKVAGVAPDNPGRGMPRITGSYLLLDGPTLRPLALLDGRTLTLLRTSAVSALAVDHLAVPDASRLLLFGTGPQALAHARAIQQVRPLTDLAVAGRTAARVDALVEQCATDGLPARAADEVDLAGADMVVCCTSSATPLFDGRHLPEHATVVAMGSHSPTEREVDTTTVTRSTVVVEDPATAQREAGEVAVPLADGALSADQLLPLQDVLLGTRPLPADRPRLFTCVGMAWQDLVLAVHAAG